MTQPSLEIIGVYRPCIADELLEEQRAICGDEGRMREHFSRLVLIEAIMRGTDSVDVSDFGQETPEGGDQVAYDEALLSADGARLLRRDLNCVAGTPPLRFAFYLHYYDPARPLRWAHGEINCPAIQEMPERLQKLVPYEPTD